MKRSLPARSVLYGTVIVALLTANLWLLVGLVLPNSERYQSGVHAPIQAGSVFPIQNATSIASHALSIPSTTKRITVVYVPPKVTDVRMGDLGLLDTISRSTIGRDALLVVVPWDWNNPQLTSLQQQFPLLEFIKNGPQLLHQVGLSFEVGSQVLVTTRDTLQYHGPILKEALLGQIWALASSGVEQPRTAVAVGDSIWGHVRNREDRLAIEDLSPQEVLLLYASFCFSCGDNFLYDAISRIDGATPLIIVPAHFRREQLAPPTQAIFPSNQIYQTEVSGTNLDTDLFLRSYPVVLQLKQGRIVYVSGYGDSALEVVESVRRTILEDIRK